MGEEIEWKTVHLNSKNKKIPKKRWGHNCLCIGEEIVVFGGFANNEYMNDLWTFNTKTMEWAEVDTTGDVPSPRSNFTMNYDQSNNLIIIFGGGGINKERFKSLHLLDWEKKDWTELIVSESIPSPWGRTYHCAELYYPYLTVFGGESISDNGDLWVFDFASKTWKQIEVGDVKPCARKFHSSALIGYTFYVIGGCHDKFSCIGDIYSLDLSSLIKNGQSDFLQWKKVQLRGTPSLARWGHTSTVFNGLIYIFGGKFNCDLNDLVVLNPIQHTICTLKVANEAPHCRRKPCCCFVGSSMVVFGGFNGEYFNDMKYVNLQMESICPTPLAKLKEGKLDQYLDNPLNSSRYIKTKGEKLYLCQSFLHPYFWRQMHMETFLKELWHLSKWNALKLLQVLYRGYGDVQSEQLQSLKRYRIMLPKTMEEKFWDGKRAIEGKIKLRKAPPSKPILLLDHVVQLKQQKYDEFLQSICSTFLYDTCLIVNDIYEFKVSKHILSANSDFFANVFKRGFFNLRVPEESVKLLQIVLYYLRSGFVVVSQNSSIEYWYMLLQLAQYLCLQQLVRICKEMLLKENDCQNIDKLFQLLKDTNDNQLQSYCVYFALKNWSLKKSQNSISHLIANHPQQPILSKVYQNIKFDLRQICLDHQLKINKCPNVQNSLIEEEKKVTH